MTTVFEVTKWIKTGNPLPQRCGLYRSRERAEGAAEKARADVERYHGPHYPARWQIGLDDEWRTQFGDTVRIKAVELE